MNVQNYHLTLVAPTPIKYDWRDMAITICVDWLPEIIDNDFDTDTMVFHYIHVYI